MILGFYGHSNSGKTTIIEGLVRNLKSLGHRVAVIKHTAHRGFSLDSEGTDSWRHRKAGADAVVLISSSESAIMLPRENRLEKLIALVQDAINPELIIIEGFKHQGHPKVAVGEIESLPGTVFACNIDRPDTLKALGELVIHGIGTDRAFSQLPGIDCGKCGLDCRKFAGEVASGRKKLAQCVCRFPRRITLRVDGQPVHLGKFPAQMLEGTLRGIVGSLKMPGGKRGPRERMQKVELVLDG